MTGNLDLYREALAASGVTVETAHNAGVRAITSEQARDLGFIGNGSGHAALDGLAFEYRHPTTCALILTRLRPDVPVDGRRYLQPTGTHNHLYVPCVLPEHLADPRFDAIIVEGEKKTLAVVEAGQRRYLVIGVSGVWSWRTSDKAKAPNRDNSGTHQVREQSRPIDDFDWITWRGRRVIVIFDSDGAKNSDVQRAEQALCRELRKRGAVPFVVSLPAGVNGEKTGVDDLLAREAPERRLATLQHLLHEAAPRRKVTTDDPDRLLDCSYRPSAGVLATLDGYIDAVTDAPAIFRPFTGLSVLAAVVGRNVTAPFGAHDLTLNLYITLLAPSSFFHKTTLISIAKRLVRDVRPEIQLPDDFTPERFLELLAKHPEGFLCWPEFAGFLARSGRDYNSGSRELLMELYDAPDAFRRELKSSSVTLDHPILSILAASATSWLADQMRASGDLRSGLLPRFCFVLAESKTKSYPIPQAADQMVRNRLLTEIRRVADIHGEASFAKIHAPYTHWYHDLEREAIRAEQTEIVSAFYTRLSVTALKIATLLELATSGRLEVHPDTLDEAIVLTDYLRAVVRHLLRVEFATSDAGRKVQRLLSVVGKWPGLARSALMQKTGFVSKELTEALATLIERGDLYEQDRTYWPSG